MLADKVEALFRNVPPALSLALAMTEKHEGRARRHYAGKALLRARSRL